MKVIIVPINEFHVVTPIQPYFVSTSSKYHKYLQHCSPVAHFYQFNLEKNDTQVIPDGTFDIFFELDADDPLAFLAGPATLTRQPVFKKNTEIFGVRLAYGMIPSLIQAQGSAYDLLNSEVNLNDLFKRQNDSILSFIEIALSSPSFTLRIAAFQKYILPTLFVTRRPNQLIIANKLTEIVSQHYGIISISNLSKELGYSDRYLRMVFSQYYGMSPKQFINIIKFQHTIHLLKTSTDLTTIGYESGYYDQAHFLHTFHKYTNCTPKRFAKMLKDSAYRNKMIIGH